MWAPCAGLNHRTQDGRRDQGHGDEKEQAQKGFHLSQVASGEGDYA
jgi:hypothetical protein